MRTWLTERFGIGVPVVGAPMAGAAGGDLAAAVSAAGGLGTIGVGGSASAAWVREQAATARASGRPFGIGLIAWTLRDRPDLLDATVEAAPDLASVSFGDYAPAVDRLRAGGVATATQVGTVEEARRAEDAGVDLLVVRGAEGGGHGRGEVATLPLLQQVLDVVGTPVLAAGGICTGRGLAAVLAAGAQGAWVGTALLACRESLTTDRAVAELAAADATSTVYGNVYDRALRTGWPSAYGGRHLRTPFFDRWVGREDEVARQDGVPEQLRQALTGERYDTAVLYAGQAVWCVRERRPAAAVVAELATAGAHLKRALTVVDGEAAVVSGGGTQPSTP